LAAGAHPQVVAGYAGFWQRLGAYLLDFFIVLALALIPAVIVGLLVYAAVYPSGQLFVTQQQQEDAQGAASAAGWAVYGLIGLVYYLVGWSSGATWGMRAMGLRMVVLEDPQSAPGFGRALVRYLVSVISGLPLYLGYLWMLWDDKKQTWHDKAAGTVVVTGR